MKSHSHERFDAWVTGLQAITTRLRDAASAKPQYRIAAQVDDGGKITYIHGRVTDFEDAPTGPAIIVKSAKTARPTRVVLRKPKLHEIKAIGIKFFRP